jgi:glyoxylase-like metal-dependent hydrolase (beta-lactamase superfamily II)/rhodanese-related sulfurtransferase
MKVQQIYTNCLAHGAYYIESQGVAAVIDPLREVQSYIDLAESRNAKIKYIFETHFHADFVSGHVDLARKTGAAIIYGPTKMKTGFSATIAEDGTEFTLGHALIRLIHTPGHTLESSCFLLIDESGKETALFTGDTLFIGDVGRPDLAQHVISELTEDILAAHLYDSLRNKIMPLADDIIVYPAHGAGSACGKNLSKETSDTLGNQKKSNYALNPNLSKEDFIKELLHGLTPPPAYFPKNVLMNINGYDSLDTVLQRGVKALSVKSFDLLAHETNALILDTRKSVVFAKGFIPGSINIGVAGSFAVWCGTLIPDINQQILIVAEPGKEAEAVTRLARVGYDHAIGFLDGGFESWKQAGMPVEIMKSISVAEFAEEIKSFPERQIFDVRKKSEYDSEHIVDAVSAPLDYINQSMELIDKNKPAYVHCASGYRSMIFCSILRSKGYNNLIEVAGGIQSMKQSGQLQFTAFVCPSTML